MTVSRACGRILSSSRAALMLALSRSPQAIDTGHSILASDGVKSRRAMSPVRDIICFLVSPEDVYKRQAYDAVDLSAQVVELLCDGVCDSAAHAAAYYSDLLQTFSVARNAEGSYEVVNELALFEVVQLFSRSAHDLEDCLLYTSFSATRAGAGVTRPTARIRTSPLSLARSTSGGSRATGST